MKPDKPWLLYVTYRKRRKPYRHECDERDSTAWRKDKVDYTGRRHDEGNNAAKRHDETDYMARKYDEAEDTDRIPSMHFWSGWWE